MCLRYLIPFLLYFLWPDLVKGQRQNKSTFKELSIDNIDTLDHNVSHVDSADVFLVTHKIQAQRFNCGCSDDPLQLLQGKVPGTLIVRPGSDPNRPFDFRIGGTSSLRYREKNSFGPMTLNTATRPLILVDGLPIENTWVVDPNDVDGLEVLSGAGASSFYGIRGANGVLKIKTIEGKEGLGVSYKTSFTFEKAMRRQLVLTADQFRGKDNTVDYGYDTDWFKAITRPAFSQMHHLALSGGRKNAFYRLSMNFRDRQGILKTTGHERINMRFNYTQFALKNKLKVTARVAFMDIGARYGFDEVFKYAYHFNPTAPVKVTEETSILHPDIFNKWGGYFQEEKYDYRNPVAVLEQNKNEGASKYSSYHFVGEYELMDDLSVSIGYSLQEEHERQGKYYGKRSYFEGDWSHLHSNGMAYWSSGDRDVKNLNVETKYSYTSGKLNLGLNGGYMWQEVFLSTIDARGGGFVSDHFSYHNLGAALDFAEGAGKVDSYKEKTTLLSFYGKAHAIYDNLGFIDINIRRDGYTPLGINNKWGTFGGGVAGINWSAILDMPFVEYMTTRVGYGVVGNYKGEAGLSLEQVGALGTGIYNMSFIDGERKPRYGITNLSNPDLQWEETREFNYGVNFGLFGNKINGSITFYSSKSTDLLLRHEVPYPPNVLWSAIGNIGQVNNRSMEASVDYRFNINSKTSVRSTFNYGRFNTTLISLFHNTQREALYMGNLGGPGSSGYLIKTEENGKPGNFWGLTHQDKLMDEYGQWQFEDLNSNGRIDDDDMGVIGNGLPSSQLGWFVEAERKNWNVMLGFRGLFGHSLINGSRLFYENPNLVYYCNVLQSSFTSPASEIKTTNNYPGSFYVEKASYFKLENLTVGRTVLTDPIKGMENIFLYINVQNLFVLTGYSGGDPEVRLYDQEGFELVPGLDYRKSWPMTRAFTMGVRFSLQ